MDEVSAKAKLATAEPGLTVSVPKREVEAALEGEGADLVLDVVRSNGDREERRVILALDEETLRRLLEQDGEQIMIAIDPESLAVSFDDVEAHGLREIGATLAIAVAAVGGGAGLANAATDQGTGASADPPTFQAFSTDFPTVQASVPGADFVSPTSGSPVAATDAAATASEDAGMPRAMPSDYAQARAGEEQMPRAMPSDYAQADAADRGIENVRAAQPPPAGAPDPTSAIEQVRTGRTAGDTQVRTGRTAGDTVEGSSLSAPEAGVAVAIAGGAMLTIAAAAFALRGRREPRPA